MNEDSSVDGRGRSSRKFLWTTGRLSDELDEAAKG